MEAFPISPIVFVSFLSRCDALLPSFHLLSFITSSQARRLYPNICRPVGSLGIKLYTPRALFHLFVY